MTDRLRLDERGQSVVIGTVLIFATLVISFSLYQATVVPNQNKNVEIDHSKAVRDDMSTLRSVIVSLSETGGTRTTSVQLGTSYPSRTLAVNPPPPQGSLRTERNGEIRFLNDNFNQTDICGYEPTTRSLVYRPIYNEYRNAPTIGYDNTVVYRKVDGNYLIDSNQTLVNDRTLFLAPLNRTYSRTGTETVSITFKAGPQDGATKSPDSEVKLTFPSKIPPDVWETNDRLFGNVDAVKSVAEADEAKYPNSITVTLKDGLYTVKCRAVGIESYPESGQSVPLSLDGPEVTDLSVSPTTVLKGQTFDIEATISDKNSGGTAVNSSEWRDTVNASHGGKLSAFDGTYDQVIEDVENTSIDTDDWATGDHTIEVRGVDAQGNIGPWREVTLTVDPAGGGGGGNVLIQGIAYKNNNGNLALYEYDSDSTTDSGYGVKAAIGGILDWENDGGVDDVIYRKNSKKLARWDKSAGTEEVYNTKASKMVGFAGDFDNNGTVQEFVFIDQNNNMEVGRNPDGSDSFESIPVQRAATGSQVSLQSVTETQITGTQDLDRDGEPEFAYRNGNKELVIADITSISSSNIQIRQQSVTAIENDVMRVGGIGDFDDDGRRDDIAIKTNTNNKYIRYYDFSRDATFLYEDTEPSALGPVLDTDADGKDELYFVDDDSGNLVYREVGDSTVKDVDGGPVSVKDGVIGGGN